tara:strand:+ start:1767 stop:2237 length:471 start_codon:yes stop_codon:yes gene_type:complete
MKSLITPNDWGPALWDILHYITFNCKNLKKNSFELKELFEKHVPNIMPCNTCRKNYKNHLRLNPIRMDSCVEFSKWLVEIHNMTNKDLKKPEYRYSNAVRRYSATGNVTNKKTIERVKRNFLKFNNKIRFYVCRAPKNSLIQPSYSAFISYIFQNI